jgi:hypothetical protein
LEVRCQTFTSSTKPWNELIQEAAEFATAKGRDRLINISVAAAGGADLIGFGSRGIIFVWYWE